MIKKVLYFFICFFAFQSVFSQHVDDLVTEKKEYNLIDGIFAVIGNQVIFHSDIENQVLQYKNQGVIDDNLKNKVVEDLFFQKMLLNAAEIDSVEVDASEIDNSIKQRVLFFEEQLGSIDKVENYFNKSIDELITELRPMIKDQLIVQKMQYEITKNIDISPLEVKNFYNDFNADSLPVIPAQYQVAQVLKVPEAADLAISETLSKLEDLRDRIVKGADFSTMAILYSEDPGSSRSGGAYYGIKKGDFVKEFEAVAFSLELDELSEIFETEYGYHVAQLINRKGNQIDVRHILMTPKISNNEMLFAKHFLDSLRIEIISDNITFSVVAKEFSSDKDTRYNGGLLINPNTNNSYFSLEELDRSILNDVKSLSVGGVTPPIYVKLPNGQEAYRIIKLVDKKEEHIANLSDDYAFLKNYCFTKKQDMELRKWYNKYVEDLYVYSKENLLQYDFYKNLLNHESK